MFCLVALALAVVVDGGKTLRRATVDMSTGMDTADLSTGMDTTETADMSDLVLVCDLVESAIDHDHVMIHSARMFPDEIAVVSIDAVAVQYISPTLDVKIIFVPDDKPSDTKFSTVPPVPTTKFVPDEKTPDTKFSSVRSVPTTFPSIIPKTVATSRPSTNLFIQLPNQSTTVARVPNTRVVSGKAEDVVFRRVLTADDGKTLVTHTETAKTTGELRVVLMCHSDGAVPCFVVSTICTGGMSDDDRDVEAFGVPPRGNKPVNPLVLTL